MDIHIHTYIYNDTYNFDTCYFSVTLLFVLLLCVQEIHLCIAMDLSDLKVNASNSSAKRDMGGVTWMLFLGWISSNYKSSRNKVAGLFICLELLYLI